MTVFHYLYPDITAAQVAAELEREEAQRRAFYPRQVEALKMEQKQADHELACIAAWCEDVARMEDHRTRSAAAYDRFCRTGTEWETVRPTDPQHKLSWRVRRLGLVRELQLRERVYARRVEELKLTPAEAAHRKACLETLAARYDDGWDWLESNGFPDLAEANAREAWEAHWSTVQQIRNPATQERMKV